MEFGKAMPALIRASGVKEWYFEGTMMTQEKLTEKILADNVMEQSKSIFIKMIETFDHSLITELVADVMGEPDKYEFHCKLREHLIANKYHEHTLFLEYYDQYNEYMYEKGINFKRWNKPGTRKEHRDKTIIKDGLTMTFPSQINDDDGTEYWCKDGILNRSDVDKYGNRLPTQDGPNGTFWNENRKQHRAELGKNPDDLTTYNKALPAIIYKDGNKEWKFEGNDITEEELTARLLGISIPKPATIMENIIELEITYANGDVRRDTHPIASIKVVQK
jgi:hypothetical protein